MNSLNRAEAERFFETRNLSQAIHDILADLTLLDELIDCGGPRSTPAYRKKLAELWTFSCQKDQKAHSLLRQTAVGATFDELYFKMLRSTVESGHITHQMYQMFATHLVDDIERNPRTPRQMDTLAYSLFGIVFTPDIIENHTTTIAPVVHFAQALGKHWQSFIESEALTKFIIDDNTTGIGDGHTQHRSEMFTRAFEILLSWGADPNKSKGYNPQTYEAEPLLLSMAKAEILGRIDGSVIATLLDAGANYEDVLNDPSILPQDKQTLSNTVAVKRKLLQKHINQDVAKPLKTGGPKI